MNKIVEARRRRVAAARGALTLPTAAWFAAADPMAVEEPTRPPEVPADYEWRPFRNVKAFSEGQGGNMRETVEAGWAMPGTQFER